ncbi:hypothetical protein OPQ81_004095 [Rhizoctonia solani]|nr:hypothetical protein OPQ81_004095 [Rhizoctonia solani]
MDVNEIQANLGGSHQQEFGRFCEMKVRNMLRSEKGLVWCRAPGCDAGQIHVGGAELPIVTCQKCGSKSCFTHESIWHEGKTCAEYTEELLSKANVIPGRVLESRKSETWIKSNTKKCPGKGCGRPIQKNDGCDHMTCRKPAGCGQEFCWVCLAPYRAIREQGNKNHMSFCKYYS